jgi:hypothetical protein
VAYPGVKAKEIEPDPHPESWVGVSEELPDGTKIVTHGMSFDHRYGPESQSQIDYWRDKGYPGAEAWEIGKAIRVPGDKAAREAMERRRTA